MIQVFDDMRKDIVGNIFKVQSFLTRRQIERSTGAVPSVGLDATETQRRCARGISSADRVTLRTNLRSLAAERARASYIGSTVNVAAYET